MAKNEEKEIKKESRIKVKKKAWHKILAPPQFQHQEMGESYLAAAESAVGRIVKINLRELTGNPKDQNAYLVFRIDKAEGLNLHTALIGYEMILSTLKRMAKLGADRLDDSFICRSKRGMVAQIKVVMVTLRKTDRSVQAKLRQILHAVLQEELSKGDFSAFLQGLVETRIRVALKKKLDKAYPVRELAVRYVRLLKAGAVSEEAAAVASELPAETAVQTEAELPPAEFTEPSFEPAAETATETASA